MDSKEKGWKLSLLSPRRKPGSSKMDWIPGLQTTGDPARRKCGGPAFAGMTSFLLLFTLFLFPCHPVFAKLSSKDDKVWIIIKPLQCMSNPWEKEWLKKHRNQVSKYPRRQEYSLVKAYFKKQKVNILDFRVQPYLKGDPRCETCECPRGDTFLLMIQADDVPKMVSLGYYDRAPAKNVPPKKPKD